MSDLAVALFYQNMSQAAVDRDQKLSMEGTDVDTVQQETKCLKCSESQQTLNDALSENEKLIGQLQAHRVDVDFYARRYAELKKRSDNITSSMADILETKGELENVNDKYANSRLGKMFEDLYDKNWIELFDWLCENVEMAEIDRIKAFSDLLQKAYVECVRLAEDQIRQFLFLDSDDKTPDVKLEPTLYRERRHQCQGEKIRKHIQKKVVQTVVTDESIRNLCCNQEDKSNDIRERIESFLSAYIDLCWLFTIAHPRLYLEFDVLDQPYSKVKERFRDYSCQEEVIDDTKAKDSVFCVVWPCVILDNASGIIAKGDVITVNIGKKQ